ncbi:hypothetical protein P4M32_002872 [Escherichia coli]|nr:hypothetical protein [Escherichia coli]EKP9131814.1 hypothetical protein [Escherichia coli]
MNTNGLLTKPLIEVTIMAIKEHSLLFIHTQTPRKRNNPFHSSVLCTHPGGRFLRDFSRRGQLAKNASNANSPGFISIGISWIFRGLASSASRRAQVSNCLCRMISSSCVCVSCIGDSVLLVMVLPCKAMRRSTSHHGADGFYPLGSMPRRFSSVRPNSLSQLARLTPSLLASLSNCSFSSGDIRIWNGGALPVPFGFLSRLITVDMCTPIALCFHSIGVHLNTRALKKAKPRKCHYHSQGF